jgi:vacuolar-type H+-ATPase subunit E/Vma4
MSELDRIVRELIAARSHKEAERRRRHHLASAFLREFYEVDIKTSQVLQDAGIDATHDETKLILHKPATGHFLEPLLIVVDEQGNIDCAGRSLGTYAAEQKADRIKKLIAEIIDHFDL